MKLTLTRDIDNIKRLFSSLEDTKDLAELLEVTPETLIYYVYRIPKDKQYKEFQINKRTKGLRLISTPTSNLKILQRKLNAILTLVYKPSRATFGFIKKLNVVKNAKIHERQHYVLNLDLKDYFDSINFGRVRGLFMARPYNFNNTVATTLANLCCYNNKLPQGAPTSPIISNMVSKKLDNDLFKYAQKNKSKYSRYADDITISSNLDTPPLWLGEIKADGFTLNSEIEQIITTNGFRINPQKIRLSDHHQRQMVTGLVVNQKVNVLRKFYRQIRSIIHMWDILGLQKAESEYNQAWNLKTRAPFKDPPSLINVIQGKLSYLKTVKGNDNISYQSLFYKLSILKIRERYLLAKEMSLRQDAGYELQEILQSLFTLNHIDHLKPFLRREGTDQIDGAFEQGSYHFLVECKWKKALIKGDLGSFVINILTSPNLTHGLFLSINDWPENFIKDLREFGDKRIIFMNGNDIMSVLEFKITLKQLIQAKIEAFAYLSKPFCSAEEILEQLNNRGATILFKR